jgi:TPP-dependent indolepyruvate ferredoxin oxidoreductase alpha subunit
MQKYLVVSYDDDQQQWFWDYVVAKTTEDAVTQVCERRPYVIAADAASQAKVHEIASDLGCRSIGQLFDFDTAEQTGEKGGNEQ